MNPSLKTFETSDLILEVESRLRLMGRSMQPHVSVWWHEAFEIVLEHYEMSEGTLRSNTRKQRISQARGVVIYLLRKHGERKLDEIAQIFGMDHTNVSHWVKQIDALRWSSKRFDADVENMERLYLRKISRPHHAALLERVRGERGLKPAKRQHKPLKRK